jgi:N-acetyl-gamma-glutamyl-phosphate reductase
VFFATPHGVAMADGPRLVGKGVKIIDLAADFRLRDLIEWKKWYKLDHAAQALNEEAVYGLPEIYRDRIRKARVVGNPGCYATAVQLGFLPLVEAGVVDLGHLVADAKSGVSGAGRKAEINILFSEAADNFSAYNVAGHRHVPEIRQSLQEVAKQAVGLTFVPHLTPMIRGIHATLYARITREADFQALFERRYANEPFVDVLPPGSTPDTRSVRAANLCRLAVHRPNGGDTLVILSVIDNLVKGAAGQAVQAMNAAMGWPEPTGLDLLGG